MSSRSEYLQHPANEIDFNRGQSDETAFIIFELLTLTFWLIVLVGPVIVFKLRLTAGEKM